MSNLQFEQVYAPKSLDDFIYPSDKAEAAIRSLVPEPGVSFSKLPPVLLYGGYGGGKTSLLKILPYAIDPNFQEPNRHFIKATTRKNLVEVIDGIQRFAQTVAIGGGLKAVCIDEADNLDDKIQQSLKATMTALIGKVEVLFILTTNYMQRMDGGLLSRSVKVNMDQRDPERFLPRMREILSKEGVAVLPNDWLLPVAEMAGTDIRELYRHMERLVDALREQVSTPSPPKPRRGLTLLNQPVS